MVGRKETLNAMREKSFYFILLTFSAVCGWRGIFQSISARACSHPQKFGHTDECSK